MRIRPVGDRALLVEVDDLAQVQALHAALLAGRSAGVLPAADEVVPAARTVLLNGVADLPAMAAALTALVLEPATGPSMCAAEVSIPPVEIPVTYDGADLPWVASQWGTSVDEAVALHSGALLRAAFCGFAPGFAYLVGLPERCHLPRRASPRPEVPAGSVAVAGEFTAVYPRTSPGGWHVIGRTEQPMWDASRPQPALVTPGSLVRFVPLRP